jgi:hypothetical protein
VETLNKLAKVADPNQITYTPDNNHHQNDDRQYYHNPDRRSNFTTQTDVFHFNLLANYASIRV